MAGDVDNAAPVAGLHARQRKADGVERGGQVDCEGLVPVFGSEGLDRAKVADDGIVDQDVEAAVVLFWVVVIRSAIWSGWRRSAGW